MAVSVRLRATVETVAGEASAGARISAAPDRAPVTGGVGIGDVLGQHLLARLRPFQPHAQHGQIGMSVMAMGSPLTMPAAAGRPDRQTLPGLWLLAGKKTLPGTRMALL